MVDFYLEKSDSFEAAGIKLEVIKTGSFMMKNERCSSYRKW